MTLIIMIDADLRWEIDDAACLKANFFISVNHDHQFNQRSI